jgi:hypothetical protein
MVARADRYGSSEYVLIYSPQTLISYPSADEPADNAPRRMDNIWPPMAPQRKLECGHFTGSPTEQFMSCLLPACTDANICTESTIVIVSLPVFLILRHFFGLPYYLPFISDPVSDGIHGNIQYVDNSNQEAIMILMSKAHYQYESRVQ